MLPVVGVLAIVVLLVVVVIGIRRGAYLSARKVQDGDGEILLESMDSASHHREQRHHDGQSVQTHEACGHGHHTAPNVPHHDIGHGSFHDSAGHSGFDGGGFHGGHH
jgi:hypothetical protein